jgi:hypothetical protein
MNSGKEQKTKSITLHKLPDDNNAIRQILLSFIADRKRQAMQIIWTKEQAIAAVRAGASITFHIQPKNDVINQSDIMREVTTQSFYIYAQTKDGVEFPFAKIDEEFSKTAEREIDMPVFIENVKYYDKLFFCYENGKPCIGIGDDLRFPLAEEGQQPKERSLKYTLNGTLPKRIANSDFLLALSQHKKIRIGDVLTFDITMDNLKVHFSNGGAKPIVAAGEIGERQQRPFSQATADNKI